MMTGRRSLAWWVVVVLMIVSCGSNGQPEAGPTLPPLPFEAMESSEARLPSGASAKVAGVTLPPGSAVDTEYWLSDEPVVDGEVIWQELAKAHSDTGLWPMLVRTFPGKQTPWSDADFYDPVDVATVDEIDVASLLGRRWNEVMLSASDKEPVGVALGQLVVPSRRSAVSLSIGPQPGTHLLLVRAARPADAIAEIGWETSGLGTAEASAILRSWEDRFGWFVYSVGPSSLEVRTSSTELQDDEIFALAAEIYAVSPGLGEDEQWSLRDFVSFDPLGEDFLYFWWD